MKVSETIQRLKEILDKVGDLDVVYLNFTKDEIIVTENEFLVVELNNEDKSVEQVCAFVNLSEFDLKEEPASKSPHLTVIK